MYVLLFFAVFSAYADMFVEHLDTELGDGDVRGLTSDSKTKAQITVLTSQYHSYFFPFLLPVVTFTLFIFPTF